jgi:5'-nucleotidase
MEKRQILLTNDDGIDSPGLWAAAEALSDLGYVTVAAPRDQSSGMGRALPSTSDGIVTPRTLNVRGRDWTVYAVGGSPAQAVLHGAMEILPRLPDLVVSGINYGENPTVGITASGTVGAALEGAGLGIPSLAISLETDQEHFFSYSKDVDFSTAAHFCAVFARMLLEKRFPPDVDLLKADIPSNATPQTPWRLTRLSRQPYFVALRPTGSRDWSQPGRIGFQVQPRLENEPPDSDVYVLRVRREVALTPLSLDLTSRVPFDELERRLRAN